MPNVSTMIVKPTPPFDFRLSTMIFSDGDPEIQKYERNSFWQVIRLGSKLILASVRSIGTVEKPKLEIRLESNEKISDYDRKKAEETVCTLFNLGFDLEYFYEQVKQDGVMKNLTDKLRGLKSPTTSTIFEALVDSIIEQQISLKIANLMERKLIKALGEELSVNNKIYYAFPTPQKLASASLEQLRACGLSLRKAEYIKETSRRITARELSLEKLKEYKDTNRIITELDKIRGVGTWTAELTMVRGMQRLEAFPADDVGLKRIISHYYCGDKTILGEEARKIAVRWGPWKGLAAYYLIIAAAVHIPVSEKESMDSHENS